MHHPIQPTVRPNDIGRAWLKWMREARGDETREEIANGLLRAMPDVPGAYLAALMTASMLRPLGSEPGDHVRGRKRG